MTLLWLVGAWIIGIVAAMRADLSMNRPAIWLVVAGAGLVGAALARRSRNWRLLFGCVLAFGLGASRFGLSQHVATENELLAYNDRGYADLTGVIVDMPDVRDTTLHLRVEMESIRDGKTEHPISGLALIYANRFESFAYGDRIRVQGQPITPPQFDTFSYRDYLARGGVYTTIFGAKITRLATGQGNPLLALSFDLRERSHQLINQFLPSPQSALLTGILLGINTDIPPEVSSAFTQTGTSHIIAISGSNITIVAGLLLVLFGRLRNKALSALLMLIGLLVYTLFVGASASVVRAAIMGGLAIIAARLGRQNSGLTALAFAVWVQTLINPLVIEDVGLILSAGATLGLILFSEPLERWAENALKRVFTNDSAKLAANILADFVLVTIAAQLTTLPIIFLIFGRFSAISFLINILIVPAQASIMSLGILSIVLGAILFPVGQFVAWLVFLPLTYTLAIIRAAAQLPGASVAVSVEPGAVVAYYVILFGAYMFFKTPDPEQKRWIGRLRQAITTPALIAFGGALAVLLWGVVVSRPDGKLHVLFLGVGDGNAVLIGTPNGAHILIDGGPNPTRLRTALGDHLPFYQRDLDLVILTQPKTSALAALPSLFSRYLPRAVLTNGQIDNSDAYRALTEAFDAANIKPMAITAGYQVQTDDGVAIQVVHPQTTPEADMKPEDAALVLRVTYGGASFLLTPELSEDAEAVMMNEGWYVGATVLQLPSHAQDVSNGETFLKAASPQVAVIEAEPGSRNLPSDLAIKRLGNIPIYRTDQSGTIEITTDGKTLWVSKGR